jgi:hypothetical protein
VGTLTALLHLHPRQLCTGCPCGCEGQYAAAFALPAPDLCCSVPHILSDESSAYYHSYVLAGEAKCVLESRGRGCSPPTSRRMAC